MKNRNDNFSKARPVKIYICRGKQFFLKKKRNSSRAMKIIRPNFIHLRIIYYLKIKITSGINDYINVKRIKNLLRRINNETH